MSNRGLGDDTTPPEAVPVLQGAGSGSLAEDHVCADNAVYTVTVTVTDDDGGVHSDTAEVVVGNLDPGSRRHGELPRRRCVRRQGVRALAPRGHRHRPRIGRPAGGDRRAMAEARLLNAWLHFVSGAVSWDAMVPAGAGDEVPFLDVMNEIEDIVSDPGAFRSELIRAAFLGQKVMQAG